jgi:hypothetical protein
MYQTPPNREMGGFGWGWGRGIETIVPADGRFRGAFLGGDRRLPKFGRSERREVEGGWEWRAWVRVTPPFRMWGRCITETFWLLLSTDGPLFSIHSVLGSLWKVIQ